MLLLARRPQQVLAPLPLLLLLPLLLSTLLFALASGKSAGRSSSSSLASPQSRLDHGGGAGGGGLLSSSLGRQSDDLGFAGLDRSTTGANAVSFHAPERQQQQQQQRTRPSTANPKTSAAVTPSNRIPFQLDFTAFHRRYARSSEASNTTKIDESKLPANYVDVLRRYRRHDSACVKFEQGDPAKQEFYSPGYPGIYPKSIDCFKVLEADPGMVLKVEFRDNFKLEIQDQCNYDYLEVRDGKYGYSRLIGKFCRDFPFPEITSSSRYLWLHFRSDNTIEDKGFRAVWSMVPRPAVKTPESEECILNVTNLLEYEIKTSEIADRKKTAAEQGTELDCIWNITVPDGWKIQMTFPQFHLDKPNECDINYVQVYDKEPSMLNNPSLINNFCGSIADLVTSKGNEAYLRFFVTKAAMNSSFEAIMTAIREKETKDKGCNDNEFDCQDACISDALRCNNRANCRYRFDEDADVCNTENTGLNMNSEHVIIILVVFSFLMFGLCFTFVFNCVKKLIRDHRIIKEHIRQSRENRLDELGRKKTSCPMAEPCTEIGGNDHHHGSESPSLEVLANPKELVSPVTIITRDFARERSVGLSVDLSDIHQSNNVSNATQERLQVSGEERETRDMECQTRESIFDTGFILKPSAHPAFTTFGFQTPGSSRKPSLEYHPSHHYHHHAHPHHHPTPFTCHHHHHHMHRQVNDTSPPSEKLEQSPVSRRCSVCHPSNETPPSRLCLRHSSTPIVPAPHGWSAHESMYSTEDLVGLQQYPPPSPARITELESRDATDTLSNKLSPKFIMRQRTVGSGENYGYIYGGGEEKDASEHTGSSGGSSLRSGGAKPVKCPQVSDSRFKTEAVIEVDQKRPFSIESTKSAPDVIATH